MTPPEADLDVTPPLPLRRKTDPVPFDDQTVEQAVRERLADIGRIGTLEQKIEVLVDRAETQSIAIDILNANQLEANRQQGMVEANIRRLANEQTTALKAQREILQLLREMNARSANGHAG